MNLTHLSDKNLITEVISLAGRERAILSQVLWHLKEVDRRKLYCDSRCGSLFEFCVKVLKYSEGQASRRVTACRLLRELPEIAEDIKQGELNLTQLNQAKHFFNEEGISSAAEKKEILEEIKGKTIKETEKILWEKRKDDTPRKVILRLNESTVEALNKLKGLRAHKDKDMDALIMSMVKLAEEAWDPSIVKRRRAITKDDSRGIQVGVKAQVWEKSKGKCANCGSTYALQIDHIHPFSMGGKTEVKNLQLLCRNCNQRKGASSHCSKHFMEMDSRKYSSEKSGERLSM